VRLRSPSSPHSISSLCEITIESNGAGSRRPDGANRQRSGVLIFEVGIGQFGSSCGAPLEVASQALDMQPLGPPHREPFDRLGLTAAKRPRPGRPQGICPVRRKGANSLSLGDSNARFTFQRPESAITEDGSAPKHNLQQMRRTNTGRRGALAQRRGLLRLVRRKAR